MDKLGISIIIPCYRAGDFLAETISSIMDQSVSVSYEIIVVDDFSQHPETATDRASSPCSPPPPAL